VATEKAYWQEIDDALNDALGPIDKARRSLATVAELYRMVDDVHGQIERFLADTDALQSECARIRNAAGDLANQLEA
jgi:hypothetical protein